MAHVPLEDQLKKLLKTKGISGLKLSSGETAESLLKSEAKKLLDILEEEIEKLYSRPEGWYQRSGDLRNSLDKSLIIDPKTNTITIGFISELAWHNSWITKTYNPNYSKQAYVPQAVREGYEVFNSGLYVKGIDFVQNAVDRFNQIKRDGITVNIENGISEHWWK